MAKRFKCWRKDKWDKDDRWFIPNKNSISVRGVFGTSPYHVMKSRVMEHGTGKFGGSRTIKVFKTKKQALKFAKSYMRKHDKC